MNYFRILGFSATDVVNGFFNPSAHQLKHNILLQIFWRLPSTNFTWSILEHLDPFIVVGAKLRPPKKHHINKAKPDPYHWSSTIRHALFYLVEESRIAESLYFKQISYNNLPFMKCLRLFHRFLQLFFWEPKSRLLIQVI